MRTHELLQQITGLLKNEADTTAIHRKEMLLKLMPQKNKTKWRGYENSGEVHPNGYDF